MLGAAGHSRKNTQNTPEVKTFEKFGKLAKYPPKIRFPEAKSLFPTMPLALLQNTRHAFDIPLHNFYFLLKSLFPIRVYESSSST